MVMQNLLRSKLLEMLTQVQPKAKWKILLVDEETLKIINSAMTISDLTDQFVIKVENIFSPNRKPARDTEAIYFVVPTVDSMRKILLDMSPPSPRYSLGHVFLTEKLPSNLSKKIKESRSMDNIATIKEIYVNFTAIEKRVFTLNLPQCLKIAFNASNDSLQKYGLQKMAKSLASILFLIDESPDVRYYGPKMMNDSQDRPNPSRILAEFLRKELDSYVDMQFAAEKNKVHKHASLLIIDRTIDMVAPVIHNSSYLGMVVDLLDFDNTEVTLEDSNKTVDLNASDSVWEKTRYMHIANAMDYIATSLQNFASTNKVAKWSKSSMGDNPEMSALQQIEKMKETITSLPKYQEITANYNTHTEICRAIMKKYEALHLDSIMSMEQDISTGAKKRRASSAVPDFKKLLEFLANTNMSESDKVRILIIYTVVNDGLSDVERKQIEPLFNHDPSIMQTLNNISYLNVSLNNSLLKYAREQKDSRYYNREVDSFTAKAHEFENDRYYPVLGNVIMDFIKKPSQDNVFHLVHSDNMQNKTPMDASPGKIFPSSAAAGIKSNLSNSSTLRSDSKASWALRKNRALEQESNSSFASGAGMSNSNADDEIDTYGTRAIVFVIGGISALELKTMYSIMLATKREVLIGSTGIITPEFFLEEIKNLHTQIDTTDLFGLNAQHNFFKVRKENALKPKPTESRKMESVNAATPKPSKAIPPPQKSEQQAIPPRKIPVMGLSLKTKSEQLPPTSTSHSASAETDDKKHEKKKKLWKFL